MSFIHTALLIGLGAIAIPIIIHLLSRRAAKVIDWGAMQFLLDSIESRKRRIQLEEALLMAARCLLMALLALAVARPFAPPGSAVPWVVVLPAFLVSLVAFTTGIILRGNRRWMWTLLLLGLAAGAYAGLSVWYEYRWKQKQLGTAGKKDIALVIDCSTSMQLRTGGGKSNFETAVEEAREIVEKADSGTAFSVILGGPVPVSRIAEPVVNRSNVQEALQKLQPLRGKMAAFDTLSAAAVSLSRGSNPNKEIIVLTDGQNQGWEVTNPGRWDALASSLGTFTVRPQVLLRKYPLPAKFRNAAVAGISYSREVIGTDRPVTINVTIENTGSEVISVPEVALGISGVEKPLVSFGSQLQPGAVYSAQFLHQFKDPGSFVLTARIKAGDDLSLDDESVSVCDVVDRLSVLIVDGNPAGTFMDRAGSFTALALAPLSLSDPSKPKEKKPVALDVEVLPLTRAGAVPSFHKYDVIIMADVPRLPESTARRLAGWVMGGGGLMVLPGVQAQTEFYNGWRSGEGTAVMPARLVSENIPKEPVSLALNTVSQNHPALKMLADAKQSDLGGTLMQRYWRMDTNVSARASSWARLANGDPFLTSLDVGNGTVLMVCSNFDAASGNITSRQAFVALVHQLVYYLANPHGQPLNLDPAKPELSLARASAEGGLKGEYFRGRSSEPVLVRIDPKLDFQWGNGRPAPSVPEDFSARWTGAIIPRYSEEYIISGWGDDSLTVTINDKRVFERGGEGRVKLEAGQFVPIVIDFDDRSGGAAMQIFWQSRSQPRELLPTECMTPFLPNGSVSETVVGRWDVQGPDQQPRKAELAFSRSGLLARVDGDILPGLYRIKPPPDQSKEFARRLSADGTIPFTVKDDVAESRIAELTPEHMEFMKKRLDILEPKDSKEILNILAGREFGEELWKYLAVGALFILLLEIALTRWIAISRRSGEEVSVSFEDRFEPSAQFKQALREVQEVQ